MTVVRSECAKSPSGRHVLIHGPVTDYCGHCGIVPRVVADENDDAPLVLVNGSKQDKPQPPAKKTPRLKPARKPTGTGRLAKVRSLIERDGLTCFYCEHELLDPDKSDLDQSQWWPTLDHLLPRVAGGSNDLDNLVLACKTCNQRKGEHLALLVEVIKRLRARIAQLQQGRQTDRIFIDHLQWELFDAGLGEMPGYTEMETGRRRVKRPKPRFLEIAMFCELGDRVCANLRAENSGRKHGRTAAVIKRGRKLAARPV